MKRFNSKRALRKSAAALAAVLMAGVVAAGAQTLTTLFTNGPTANRINLVLLSEGYQAAQLPQFLTDATNITANLLSKSPYSEYSNYFNAYAISVASVDSGSDHPPTLKNTYFNSSYNSYGLAQLITIPPNNFDANPANGKAKLLNLLTNLCPQYDLVVLVVNDATYGGSGNTPEMPDSIVVTSLNGTTAGRDIVAHEIGHALGGLADEYASAAPTGYVAAEYPNSTSETNRSQIKWRDWIDESTPIPTPGNLGYLDSVGLFPGAQYQSTGWYRPKLDCKMNHLGQVFCEVCSEQLVKSIYGLVRPFDSSLPSQTNLSVSTPQLLSFSVGSLQPANHDLNFQWMTNGVVVPNATGNAFQIQSTGLGLGDHTVSVQIIDPTDLVRNDPAHLLQATRSWSLTINQVSLTLTNAQQLPDGGFTFRIVGNAPTGVIIQTSTNLPDWMPLATNSLINGSLSFTNPGLLDNRWRFYRATVP